MYEAEKPAESRTFSRYLCSSPAKLEAEVLPEHSRKNVGTRVTSVFGLFVLAGVPQLFQIIYVIKLSQILPPFKKLKPESPAW